MRGLQTSCWTLSTGVIMKRLIQDVSDLFPYNRSILPRMLARHAVRSQYNPPLCNHVSLVDEDRSYYVVGRANVCIRGYPWQASSAPFHE